MEVTADTYQKMAALVNSLTSDIADLGVDDITYTAEILHSLIRSPLRAASRDDLNAFLMSVTQTISNIVMSNSSAVLQAQTTAKSSERTLFAIGNITQVILSANNTDVEFETVASGLSYRLTKESQISGVLSLEAELNEDTVVYVNEKSSNYSLINNDKVVGLFLKKELARTSRKGFALYSNVNLFRRQRSADEGSGLRSGGRVVSATMVDESGQLISEIMGGVYQDLVTIHYPIVEYDSSPPVCGFWDLDLGDWSTDGCLTAENGGDVVCSCNHLTDFSVLLDVNRQAVVDGADDIHRQVLSIISIVGLSISIATLSLVILTAMIYRRLRKNDSQKVLVCLALSLFGLNVTFLVGVSQRGEGASCIAAAVIIHYFLLTSFAWMLVEAIIQYLRFVKVLGTYIPKFMLKVTLSAFLAPLAIIIVVLAVDYKLYISEDSDVCWMKREAIYYSVLIPVGLVIIINTIVFIMVIHGLTCRRSNVRSNQSKRKLALLHFKASLAIFIILGITWVFGLLALIPDSTIAFQYMFCIFNCFQGLLIFIFHYAREPTVRQEWRSIFRRIKLSSSGGKSTVSTNQHNSNSIPSQSKPADQTNNMNNKSNPYKPDWLNGNNKEEEL